MTRQIFLDTETTGLEVSKGHRVVEVACVEMVNRRLTRNNFQRYLNPERDIEPGAQEIHGLSRDFLADKPRFADVVDALLEFIGDAELVIHNAPFDVGFLNAEMTIAKRAPLDSGRTIIDTLAMAREQFPGRKNSLNALCDRLDVDNAARTLHGALLDAELLAEVYLAMTRGQDSLAIGLETPAAMQRTALGGGTRPATLKVLRASEAELTQHAAVRLGLQNASGGKAVWEQISLL